MDQSFKLSRAPSISSNAPSAYSLATSTRHMLPSSYHGSLDPLNTPFSSTSNSRRASGIYDPSNDSSGVSLSVNYIPHKFSSSMLFPGGSLSRKRKGGQDGLDPMVPKQGAGLEAFRSGEPRMAGYTDEDYLFGNGQTGPARRLRWNRFKWTLFVANVLLTIYSLIALIFCLLTWFNSWRHADVVRVGNRSELVLSTLASAFGLITSIVGWAGVLLNNRGFLAVWTFFLWITFAFMIIPGYVTYRRRTFNLQGKINSQWSRHIGNDGRLRIQNELQCCGYFSPFVEATVSQTCYARSVLPGCKGGYLVWQRRILEKWYLIVFALVPVHIGVMIVGLLCSNHVTYRFGKGMMPKAYRLSMNSMAVIVDNYANQLAEQYGSEIASKILSKSRSNLHLDSMQAMPYTKPHNFMSHAKYESVGGRAPESAS